MAKKVNHMKYSEKVTDAICERIGRGESLVKICKDSDMPSYSSVMSWLNQAEKGKEDYLPFLDKYARARENQADFYAEEIIEIADNDSLDIGFDDEGKPFVKGENIQRSRLRVEARKWVASKLKPKKYGDKSTTTIAGDSENPLKTKLEVTFNVVHPK